MNWLIFLIAVLWVQPHFTSQNQINECKICGEYNGGLYPYAWTTLVLKENNHYTFYEGQHTDQSRSDKGKWQLDGKALILNSSKKTRWKKRRMRRFNSLSEKTYFFNQQTCDLYPNAILIHYTNDTLFNVGNYLMIKAQEED